MGMVDEILGKFGVTIDDLQEEGGEKETFFKMLAAAEGKQITLDTFKVFMRDMITACEKELAITPEVEYYFLGLCSRPNRLHVQLKARLLNYLILESFLLSPERARRMLEETIARSIKKGTNV